MDGGTLDATALDARRDDASAVDAGVDAGPACIPSSEFCDARDNDCDGQVDEADNVNNTVCDCPRHVFAGGTYLFCSESRTWEESVARCDTGGYQLMVIETAEENDWFTFESGRVNDYWWIGLSRVSDSNYEWVTGVEVWNGDGGIGYTNFSSGSPNIGFGRRCGITLEGSGRWWMERCGNRLGFICEAPPVQ